MDRLSVGATFAERASASKQAMRSAAAIRARLWKLVLVLCVFPVVLSLRIQVIRPELLLFGFTVWAYLLVLFCKSRLYERRLRRDHDALMGELAPPAR